MPEIYIGNASKQLQEFHYRLPEGGPRRQTIPVGQQIRIRGLSQPDVDAIIKQHSMYGFVDVKSIPRDVPFAGLCYSTEGPIKVGNLLMLLERNTEVLEERGKEIRQQAAVAINKQLDNSIKDNPDLNASLRLTDVSIVEQEPVGGYRTDRQIAEGYKIPRDDPNASVPEGDKSSRQRRRK